MRAQKVSGTLCKNPLFPSSYAIPDLRLQSPRRSVLFEDASCGTLSMHCWIQNYASAFALIREEETNGRLTLSLPSPKRAFPQPFIDKSGSVNW